MKKLTVKTKFQMGSAVILLLFCALISVSVYYYLKNFVTEGVHRETEIFIATADATRTYVKDVLRPTVISLLPADSFIPQAMSTSFVGREVMSRLRQRFPEFQYKRAAKNPMNPINKADKFELDMLQWFASHRSTNEWHGLIKKENRSYYTRLRAIYAESECLKCHGNPEDAPQAMKDLYGTKSGYYYKEGDVVAADTIYIPVDVSFERIKETAWIVYLIAITSLFSLIALHYLLFNRTVVLELKGLLATFRNISGNPDQNQEILIEESGDEVQQLKVAFENVAADLQQAHDELKVSETKYRLLFETSRDAILILDGDTRVIDINRAGIKLFGFKNQPEALSIETFYQLFRDTRDADSFFRTVKEKGFIQGLEVTMVDRSGKKITVMVSATDRRDENDQFAGINGVFHDITERRKIEKYLVQTEKLASIGQLASGVAHEINNPLEVIRCYSNLIAKGQASDNQLANDIQIIQKHTDYCKTVVEALLNFARVSEPIKIKTDIHNCIEEVLSVLERQMQMERITVRRDFSAKIPMLTVDAQKIRQVFMNLIMNARQAMTEGGEITVRTMLQNEGNWLAIEVADTGPGISDEHLGRIFDPFFTTKEAGKGTGLGLSVSYGIIKQHGGDVEVESALGKGSTFTVLLPTDDALKGKLSR